jgi:general L-amino acid transport system substrate-binding protein
MTIFHWPVGVPVRPAVHSCRIAVALAALALGAGPCAAQTLAAVKQRGTLVCGVSEGILGFSAQSDKGWAGFDVDLCRALAAAVFDDPGKVRYVPLNANDRFAALQSGTIDVLSRNSTWTMSRETELKLVFPAVTYFDGQGFMIRRNTTVSSALELGNTKVCVQQGTTTELNLVDYFNANNMELERVASERAADVAKAYDAGLCDAFTSDVSQLHAERLGLAKPDDHIILPDIISKEPLGPAVRQGDEQWANIVKWTVFAMINAEELGVSSKTIDQAARSTKPEIKRLVGTDGNFGEQVGLTKDWAVRIIKQVGNYGEVFERNVGTDSRLGIPRGLNHLWTTGGILYAPPIR